MQCSGEPPNEVWVKHVCAKFLPRLVEEMSQTIIQYWSKLKRMGTYAPL